MPRKLAATASGSNASEVAKLRSENWPSSEIGHDLHPVQEGEEDHRGADERELVEALRQDVDLKRRRADLDQKRHEAGQRAPQDAERGVRPLRFVGGRPS